MTVTRSRHRPRALAVCLGLPATALVASYGWDELERVILASPALPDVLHVEIRGVSRSFDLTEAGSLPSIAAEGFMSWRLLDEPPTWSTLFQPVGPASDAFLLPRVEGPLGDGDVLDRLLREQLP